MFVDHFSLPVVLHFDNFMNAEIETKTMNKQSIREIHKKSLKIDFMFQKFSEVWFQLFCILITS